MLHAPDFLGYPRRDPAWRGAPDAVERGLALKKAGNEIMQLLGGREIHPVNVRVGGFYRVPSRGALSPVAEGLRHARELAVEMLAWVAAFDFPDFERDYEFVALRHPSEYPFNEGRIVSSAGVDVAAGEFAIEFQEHHVRHSTALHALRRTGTPYVVGPLARYNLNFDRFPAALQALGRQAGLAETCRNPYKSIVVRALEVIYACDEALRIIAEYEPPVPAAAPIRTKAGEGHSCTEAPRGILYHRYRLAGDGTIEDAQIVPPTSQNQASLELDLADIASGGLDLPDDALRDRCEQGIRNYDPCISCATHFLTLTVHRG